MTYPAEKPELWCPFCDDITKDFPKGEPIVVEDIPYCRFHARFITISQHARLRETWDEADTPCPGTKL